MHFLATSTILFFTEQTDLMKLVPPEILKDQFNARLISILVNMLEAERSANQNDWFDAPAPEELESDPINEALPINLLEISEKFLPNFNYKEEVEKGFVNTTDMKQRSKRSVDILVK